MQMADTAGLFDNVTQNTLSQLRDKNGNKINVTMEQFNEILQKLRNNPASLTNQELYILANVAEIGLKDGGYNRRLGNIDDGFWGAQHMTNMQAAISDRMQMMGDSAIVLNKFARGEALNDQEKELLLKIYNMANPNAKISDLSQATITGINNTFDFIQNQIQRIVDAVSKTEKGMFGRFNTVLQENLKRATGIIDQIGNAQAVFNLNASGNIIDVNDDLRNFSTVVSGMINPKGLTNEQIQKAIETYNAANPNAQIKDLSQMTEEGINNVYSSVSASSSSSSIAQSAASITSQLEGNITVSQATKDNLTKNFTEALANQLRANLINGFTNQEIQVVAIALAKSNGDIEKAKSILGNNTSAISLLDNIFNRNNPALINNFQAVGNLFNRLNEVQTEKVNLRIISSNMEKAEAMIGRLKGKEGEYNLATAKSLFDGINQIENQLKEAYDVSDISQLPQDVRDRFNKLKADANSVIRRIEEANNGTQVVRSNISSVNQAKQSGYNTGQTDGTNNTSNAGQTDGTNNTSNAGQTDGTNNTSNTGQTDGTNNTSNAGQTDGTNNTSNTGQTDGTNNTSNTGQTDGTNNTSNAGQTDGTNNTSNTGQTDGTNNTSNTGQTDGTNSQSSFNKDDKSLVEKILNDILENQDLSDVEKLEKVQELGRIYRNGSIFAKAALEELLEKGNDMIKQEASDQLNGSGKFLESMDAISQGFTKLSAFFDEIAILFFAIADKIMKKAFQEAQFDYGFSGQNNGSIASRYKDGANSPITDIYVNMKKMYNDSYAAWISMAQYEAILAGDEKKVHKLSENIKIAEENFKEMLRNLYEGNSQEINEQLKDAANKGNRLAKFAMGLPSLSFQKLGLKVDSIEQAISEAGRNLRTNDYKATARLANALNRGADPNNRDPDAMFYADNLNAYFASRNSQDNNNYIQSLQEVAVSRNSNFNQKNRAIRQIRDEAITGRLERAEESLRSLEEIINDSNATQEVKDRALEALADIALKGNLRIAQQSLEILKNNAMSSTASKQTKDKSMSLIVDVALSDRQISKNATELLKSNTIDDDLKLKAIYYAQAKDKEKSVDLIGNKK
ncbi:MAG: hypothetical protein KatS3mg068_1623 [Candidatus Sericytochromatia bacterium]|nr:MAG: hypothetical protein KatS3mg068_1623 [Candidatus Sericytochromatia bacterium]